MSAAFFHRRGRPLLNQFVAVCRALAARGAADARRRRCRCWPGRSRTPSRSSPMIHSPTPKPRSARWPPAAIRAPSPSSARCRTAGCWPIAATKQVFIKQPDGKLVDAATGAPVAAAPASASRRAAQQPAAPRGRGRDGRSDAAVAGSRPTHPGRAIGVQDPRRGDAADWSTPRSKAETNAAAKRAFNEARAAILLFKPDATDVEKLEAIATIKARGDQEALALLTGLTGEQSAARARAAPPPPRPRSSAIWRCGRRCRTPGTGCRSARCCCSPRSGSPSPSA